MLNDHTLYPAQFNRREPTGSGASNASEPELCRAPRAVDMYVRRLVVFSTEKVETIALLDQKCGHRFTIIRFGKMILAACDTVALPLINVVHYVDQLRRRIGLVLKREPEGL